MDRPLPARPAEVLDVRVGGGDQAVDLLRVVPAHVADPELPRARAEREPERVAEAVGDDPAGVGIAAAGERVRRKRLARVRVHAHDGAVEARRVRRRAEVLAAQRAALAGRRGLGAAHARGRVAAGVARNAVLAVVDEVWARSVAAACVEGAVRPEAQVADAVRRPLLAPVLDQHLLRADHLVPLGLEAREPGTHDAAVRAPTRRIGAGVVPFRRRAADLRVVGVEHVDERLGGEVGVEREAEQSAVPVVVHLRPQVGERRRRRVSEPVEDLDAAGLLRHEDAPVGRDAHGGRRLEVAEGGGLLEAGQKSRRACAEGRRRRCSPSRPRWRRTPGSGRSCRG